MSRAGSAGGLRSAKTHAPRERACARNKEAGKHTSANMCRKSAVRNRRSSRPGQRKGFFVEDKRKKKNKTHIPVKKLDNCFREEYINNTSCY